MLLILSFASTPDSKTRPSKVLNMLAFCFPGISKLNEYTIEILEVHTSKSSLEEVFVKLTND